MKRNNAFTLIELLVVIAIIAILAAVLMPVFAAVREKARQSACMSNEKQLALAMIQYTQDNDGRYTGYCNYGFGGDWGTPIMPYVKSTAVFHCPDFRDLGSDYEMNGFLGCDMTYNGSATAPFANMANGQLRSGVILCNGPDYKFEPSPGVIAAKVALPTVTWLFWEGNDYYYTSGSYYVSVYQTYNAPGDPALTPGPNCPTTASGPFDVCWYGDENQVYQQYHHGMNIAYCDGHVKFLTQPILKALGTTTSFAGAMNGTMTSYHSNGVNDQEPNL